MNVKLAIIGCGNMGSALAAGVLARSEKERQGIVVVERDRSQVPNIESSYGVPVFADASALSAENFGPESTVVLAVKPQDLSVAARQIAPLGTSGALLVSMLAGKRLAELRETLPTFSMIVRVMPNLPAKIGRGVTAVLQDDQADPLAVGRAKTLFDSVGRTTIVYDEKLLDVVTAVSGSGPAYLFTVLEHWIRAAVELGLPEPTAREIVLETCQGAIDLCHYDRNATLDCLIKQVSSRGGTTEAAMRSLQESEFGINLVRAIKEAYRKANELSHATPR